MFIYVSSAILLLLRLQVDFEEAIFNVDST